jgi:hypothetical protein
VNNTGHIKDTEDDDNGYRQFIINCYGENDQRKYFSISPFGIDFNSPVDTRTLVSDSKNKDIKFSLGVLNKIKIDDLKPGEMGLFSTDEPGETIMSQIVFRNTGDIEINKGMDANIIIGVDGSIKIVAKADITIESDGNVIVTATQFSANGNLTVD